jgi:hypothetical protein
MGDGEFLLSTKDNPFNPYTQWNEWYAYDERMGYHTSGLLARIVIGTDDLFEEDQKAAYAEAADFIIENLNKDFYVKIPRPSDVEAEKEIA